jgi:hypothetical protein
MIYKILTAVFKPGIVYDYYALVLNLFRSNGNASQYHASGLEMIGNGGQIADFGQELLWPIVNVRR